MSRNFFTDRDSVRTIDSRRIQYLVVAIVFFIITETGRFVYRPFIYSNKLNDFGLADSIGNLGGIIVQIFFMLFVLNSPLNKGIRIIGFLVIGYIVYEIAQPYLPRGVFDWNDVYGTVIGGAIALLLLRGIHALKNNKLIHKF